MLKHIVMWNIKKEVKDVEKVKREAKEAIEGLYGKVPAIQKITFVTETLPSSNIWKIAVALTSFIKFFSIFYENITKYEKPCNPL